MLILDHLLQTYGTKYINVEDGDYFLDLETGKVTTDSIKENAEDDAASALRKNVKKDTDGRYTAADAEPIKDLAGNRTSGNKFGQVWYGVKYAADKATNASCYRFKCIYRCKWKLY